MNSTLIGIGVRVLAFESWLVSQVWHVKCNTSGINRTRADNPGGWRIQS